MGLHQPVRSSPSDGCKFITLTYNCNILCGWGCISLYPSSPSNGCKFITLTYNCNDLFISKSLRIFKKFANLQKVCEFAKSFAVYALKSVMGINFDTTFDTLFWKVLYLSDIKVNAAVSKYISDCVFLYLWIFFIHTLQCFHLICCSSVYLTIMCWSSEYIKRKHLYK